MARATLACGVDKKDNSLTVRLSEGTKKEFKAAAEARGRSMGWLAVNIIERWLKARRRKRTD